MKFGGDFVTFPKIEENLIDNQKIQKYRSSLRNFIISDYILLFSRAYPEILTFPLSANIFLIKEERIPNSPSEHTPPGCVPVFFAVGLTSSLLSSYPFKQYTMPFSFQPLIAKLSSDFFHN